jgi:4,4'-diaponeurosporenoate glycosyltransferase
VTLALAGMLWLAGFVFLWRVPRCQPDPSRSRYPKISIIIPARDEEKNLATLLPSLVEQEIKPYEILVVDDHSRDRTGEIARQLGARVVVSRALPSGWLGKPWACQQGGEVAAGEILLFLDADTYLESGGLRKIIDTFLRQPGVLSLSPYHRPQTWAEQFSAFFNIMQAAGMNAFSLKKGRHKPAGLFGPCLAIRQEDYRRVGGHAAVKGQLLENYSLARALTDHDIPANLYGGQGALNVRLYPGGLADVARGWSKSFARGAGQTPALPMMLTILWISGQVITTTFLLQALAQRAWPASAGWLAAYGLYAAQCEWHLRRLGEFKRLTAWLFPIPLVFFLLIFIWSSFLLGVRKQVRWKGRTIGREG